MTLTKKAIRSIVSKLDLVKTAAVKAKNLCPHKFTISDNYTPNRDDDDYSSKKENNANHLENTQDVFRNVAEGMEDGAEININLKNTSGTIYSSLCINIYQELSCGVGIMINISSLEQFRDTLNKYEDGKKLLKDTLKVVIAKIKKEGKLAYITASNNTNCPWSSSILDELAIAQTPTYIANPNTEGSSKIKMWIF